MSILRPLSLLAVLLLPACDPPKPGAPAVHETKTNVTGDRAGLATCLETCQSPKDSKTDRATCRLNCQTSFKVTPSPADDPALHAIAICMGQCRSQPGAPAAATACCDDCRTREGGETPPAADVLNILDSCVASCHADASLDLDSRATCRLNCTQSAKHPGPQ